MECFFQPDQRITNKAAGFDLDGTLIRTKSKRRFPKDKYDWILMNERVKSKLKGLYEDGYTIIVFTNQKNLEKRMKKSDFRDKCMSIQQKLEVPLIFYVSLQNNYMRKPFPGMFEHYVGKLIEPLIFGESFYVGDAWSKTECFSDSDACFAKNCRLSFYKAGEFFGSAAPNVYDIGLPQLSRDKQFVTHQLQLAAFIADKQYLFIVGAPATGKTAFCTKYLPDYVRLSKDDYKTPARYRTVIQENIDDKLVFDNTNSTASSRGRILSYLEDTEKVGYIVRNVPKKEAMYLNKYRHFITRGKVALLPEVAIYTHYKRLAVPTGLNVFTIPASWINKLKEFYC